MTGTGLSVYAFLLSWPANGILTLMAPAPATKTTVSLLGYDVPLMWASHGTGMDVLMPMIGANELPCKWAWVLKIDNLS